MKTSFVDMLAVGGPTNSLGKVTEVINHVLQDQARLPELYECLFTDDAWVRMRAADALEKICRQHPDWLLPYIDRLLMELSSSTQPSIQWHLAQIYSQVELTGEQRDSAVDWLQQLVATTHVDWIVAANALATLATFTRNGAFPEDKMVLVLQTQRQHKSAAVVKRADKLLAELSAT